MFKVFSRFNDPNSINKLKESTLDKQRKVDLKNFAVTAEVKYHVEFVASGVDAEFSTAHDAERFMKKNGLSTEYFKIGRIGRKWN